MDISFDPGVPFRRTPVYLPLPPPVGSSSIGLDRVADFGELVPRSFHR